MMARVSILLLLPLCIGCAAMRQSLTVTDEQNIDAAIKTLNARGVPVMRTQFEVSYWDSAEPLRDTQGRLCHAYCVQVMRGATPVIVAQRGMDLWIWEHEIEHAWVMTLRTAKQ